MIRLDKYLADTGAGTRTEVKTMIRKGRVTVNGINASKAEQKINEAEDEVCLDGEKITLVQEVYYMLNKPAGYVSSTEEHDGPSVMTLLKDAPGKNMFPAGRLDKDTEGLLLITNDGALAHDLLSPKKHVDKTYFARIEGKVTEEDILRFKEGLDIGEKNQTLPADLKILTSDNTSEILLTICEGKFHQVKRMFEAVDKKVTYLKRMSMGALQLDPSLEKGSYRALTQEELHALKKRKGNG